MTLNENDASTKPTWPQNGPIRTKFVVFPGGTEEEPGFGVKARDGEKVLYAAHFYRDTAARIVHLLELTSSAPNWEELEQLLNRDGYDTKFVSSETENKGVSPSRRYLVTPSAISPTSSSMVLGAFRLDASVDEDGHLTVIVKSTDGSQAVEVDTEVGCADDELGYRFTSQKTEQDYLS